MELMIEEAVEEAQRQGLSIVTDKWGIKLVDDKWTCKSNYCCPLGAVLLKHQLVFPEEHFLYFPTGVDTRKVRHSAIYAILNFLHVNEEWYNSFIAGISNSKISYYSDTTAYELGAKYYKKFGKSII